MKKYAVAAMAAMMCLSLSSMASLPRQIGTGANAGFENDGSGAWVYNVQKGEGWKIRDASVSGAYSTIGVTQKASSLELVDTNGASAQRTLGIGLWRIWDDLKTAGAITVDVTLNNPGGNTTIPNQWFEMDFCFNGAFTGWADSALTKQALVVPWTQQTYSLTFIIPQALRDKVVAAGSGNSGDLFMRTYHGAAGAKYWIDNAQLVPEPATMIIMALGGLMAFKQS